MKVRNLAWLTGITLAACSAGEVAPAGIETGAGAASMRVAGPTAGTGTAASVSAPMATAESGTPAAAANADRTAPLPSDENHLAGPVLPPEVVSVMTYDQFRLTLDPHGSGIRAFETGSGSASDVVLGSPSVVDEPAPPADIHVE